MNARTTRLRALILRDPGFGIQEGTDQGEAAAALHTDPSFRVTESTAGYGEAVRAVQKSEVDFVIVDEVAGDPASVVEQLDQAAPDVPIVVLLGEDQASAAHPCVIAGARAFLFRPYEPAELIELVRSVRTKEERRRRIAAPAMGGKTGRIVVVHGPKGGVGTTTIAVNLAVAMHQRGNLRVALVDGSLLAGDVGISMNISTNNSIADLAAHLRELDGDMLDSTLVRHSSGVWVLPSPSEFERAEVITGEETGTILSACRAHYDVVIVDTPSRPDEHLLAALDLADAVLVVCTPEIASLKNVARFLALSHELGYGDEKLKLIVNRNGSYGAIPLDDIESNLRHKMRFGLPNDSTPVLESLNAGEPVVRLRSTSRVALAFAALGGELAGDLALPGHEPETKHSRARGGLTLLGRLRAPKATAVG